MGSILPVTQRLSIEIEGRRDDTIREHKRKPTRELKRIADHPGTHMTSSHELGVKSTFPLCDFFLY